MKNLSDKAVSRARKLALAKYGSNHADNFALRDLLLQKIGRCPRTPRDLLAALIDDWGRLEERRFWRAIRWLLDRGKIKRHGGPASDDVGYARTTHGGQETAKDLQIREWIAMDEQGLCYGRCGRRVARAQYRGRYCVECYRKRHNRQCRERESKSKTATSFERTACQPPAGDLVGYAR